MSDDLTLAHAFVALPRWEWRKGMVDTNQYRMLADNEQPAWLCDGDIDDGGWLCDDSPDAIDGSIPDLSCPATLGAILGLVREARREPLGHVRPEPIADMWGYFANRIRQISFGPTEAHALYEALKGAP